LAHIASAFLELATILSLATESYSLGRCLPEGRERFNAYFIRSASEMLLTGFGVFALGENEFGTLTKLLLIKTSANQNRVVTISFCYSGNFSRNNSGSYCNS